VRRYVLLRHDHPSLHWDLLLEAAEHAPCPTWRLPAPLPAGQAILAVRLPDHRPHYLTYEGPISGNRGTVQRERSGHFQILLEEPGRLEILLRDASGEWLLTLQQQTPLSERWLLHLREASRPSEVSP
jgi:hypothetical protein